MNIFARKNNFIEKTPHENAVFFYDGSLKRKPGRLFLITVISYFVVMKIFIVKIKPCVIDVYFEKITWYVQEIDLSSLLDPVPLMINADPSF